MLCSKSKSLIVQLLLLTLSCAYGAEFGAFCNDSRACDTGLFCHGSICACADPETVTYDPLKQQCVLRVGQRCQISKPDAAESTQVLSAVGARCCGSNSTCSPDSLTCACDVGFYSDGHGLCTRRNNFGDACAEDADCQYDGAYLTCVAGRCGCDGSKSMYRAFHNRLVSGDEEIEVEGRAYAYNSFRPKGNPNGHVTGEWLRGDADRAKGFIRVRFTDRTVSEPLEQCVGLAGKECNPESHCVVNSQCAVGICSCGVGFTVRADGRCGAQHNKRCTPERPCANGLSCVGGTCRCPQLYSQLFHAPTQTCQGRIYADCSADSDCGPNLRCTVSAVSGRNHCLCADGFTATPQHYSMMYGQSTGWSFPEPVLDCRKSIGPGTPCESGVAERCDAGLECRDELCACGNAMTVYSPTLRRCLERVGSRCFNKDAWKLEQVCVNGAECVQPSSDFPGYCACKAGFNYTEEGLCQPQLTPLIN